MSRLIDRAQRILLAPKAEWPLIAAEPETTAGIYRGYIAILAAIGPAAMFVKSTLIGSHRVGMMEGLFGAIVSYGLSLVAVYVCALIVNALAPTFGGQKDSLLALKTASLCLDRGVDRGHCADPAVHRRPDPDRGRRLQRVPAVPGFAGDDESAG